MKIKILLVVLGVAIIIVGGFFFLRKSARFPSKLIKVPVVKVSKLAPTSPQSFSLMWVSDFSGRRILAFDRNGQKVWEQNMAAPPIPASGYSTHTEYVTIAPNGNLIVSDGEGMFVQEIDRKTHKLLWQYGVKDIQSAAPGYLHQPDKTFKINDHEVLINDGNNRRVIIVDQRDNKIVWQYGVTLQMGKKPGMLMANTNTVPLKNGKEILITDTLQKKVLIVDRETKQIVWEWTKSDADWIQHVFPTFEGTFVMEDRNKNEVFEVNREGKILWILKTLADGKNLSHPTDVAKLGNGNVLIAESGRNRVIEVNPATREVVKIYPSVGLVTTIALDQNPL